MKLINHVLHIRGLIQQAIDNTFSRLGLLPDVARDVDDLTDDQKQKYHKLADIIETHKVALDDNYPAARKEAIDEYVFTLFNRLAAIKVMEDRELFPEVIRRRTEHGNLSYAHRQWLEENPYESSAERMGLENFLRSKTHELFDNYRIPIFSDDCPYTVSPTADELDEIVNAMNAIEQDSDCGADVWKGDDILGWMYENFNSVEKVLLKESDEKTEFDKVSLQSQVYTPRWVVKFLVDNSLGKMYLEMFPDSNFTQDAETGETKYLIANATKTQVRQTKKITELRVIDPACGSGNFLIYAFTELYDMYVNQIEQYGADYSRRDIPALIVENNLYGVDLDERAVQITQTALYIKAMELKGRRGKMPTHTNVVSTHFALPNFEKVESAFMFGSDWDSKQKKIIKSIWEDLRNAHKFGTLIRVEEQFDELLPVSADNMFANEWKTEMFSFKDQMITTLRNQVQNWNGEGSNDYARANVNDALSFLNILTQKFDVAVANPPYTDSANFGPELKTFVENNYKKPYKVNINLYATFIKRCCDLVNEDGKIGMIHPHTFMFIKTFEDIRKMILDDTHINIMVDYGLDRVNLFGPGILLDATFYTLDKGRDYSKADGLYFNITANQQEKCKKDSLIQAYSDVYNGIENDRVYQLPQSKLKEIKSWPFIYWISDEFREKFSLITFNEECSIVEGCKTANNFKFLRFWWERNTRKNFQSQIYPLYTKGGEYCKWYGNLWLELLWGEKGENFKKDVKACANNEDQYFKEGITFTGAGSKGVSFRYLPENSVFDTGSRSIFPINSSAYLILGLLNSSLCYYILECLNPTVNTTVGDIKRIPYVSSNSKDITILEALSKINVSIKKLICSYHIIEVNYTHSPIGIGSLPIHELNNYYNYENALLTQILLNEAIINSIVFDIYELSAHDRQMVLDKEGVPIGDLSVSEAAKSAYIEWLEANTQFPASDELQAHISALEIDENLPHIDDIESLYQNNNGWEEFCIKQKMNPIEVWYQFRNANILPPQRTQSLAFELITDVIRAVLAKDDDGVIPLAQRMGEDQMSTCIEQELNERGYSEAQISGIVQLLGAPLDDYLLNRFFRQLSDHLNLFMHLPKTPFIWHITSGQLHAMELFISIYTWNRNTLMRIKSVYCANAESQYNDRLASIDATTDSGQIEATDMKAKLQELRTFVQKIDNLLASGYNPKLDDGVGKNIAPLQKTGLLSYDVLNAGQLKKYLNADW